MEQLFEEEYPYSVIWMTPRREKDSYPVRQYYGSYRAALSAWTALTEHMLPGEEVKLLNKGYVLEAKKT